jgi:aryl-alcohol dehydrogenase-like predicted oxidoreductase/histidinol phosphatase-like enzyme/predicted kinase
MWPLRNTSIRAMGCMRLSTAPDRDRAAALATLHAAFTAGITLLDTADAYCHDDRDTGHNERLIAEAIATWDGDRSRIVVATKGGLRRPDGLWVSDGRARHLAAAWRNSCRALGIDRIALYQLHAPDPKTPLATSVRALAALQADGLVERLGLCNVTVGQIEQARRVVAIDAVQVELSVRHDAAVAGGVVQYCLANGIPILAYRPLGGPQGRDRVAADPVLNRVAERHDATACEIALAWLADLSPLIVPLAGASRLPHVQSIARAAAIVLTDADRRELDERFPHGRVVRSGPAPRPVAPVSPSRGEIVMIMGIPGAGKSTLAQRYVADGYERLNRDAAGGALKALVPALQKTVASGRSRIVLDNTYVSRKSRSPVIEAAHALGLPVRLVWQTTSIEEAQVNAVSRMVRRYGRLLAPDEMKAAARSDVAAFGPMVQFKFQRELEAPDVSEGFASIEHAAFERLDETGFDNRALIVWCDGVLWRSRNGARTPEQAGDVEIVERRGSVLARYRDAGWLVLGLSWQPEIAAGARTPADVAASVEQLRTGLGVPIEVAYCAHEAGPPVCWCRKPLPGLGVQFVYRHRLDARRCLYVGDGAQDPGFARRLGFQFRQADAFFASEGLSVANGL